MFVGFVGQSHAIEITSVSPGTSEFTGFYSIHSVETDKPIYSVSWCVDDELVASQTFDPVAGPTSTYCTIDVSNYPGHIKGNEYEVEVEVWEWDADDEVFRSDTEDYVVTALAPVVTSFTGTNSGFYGYARVLRHYFNGTTFVMEADAYAYNDTDETLHVGAWFQQKKYKTKGDGTAGGLIEIRRDPHIDAPLEFEAVGPGEPFSDYPDSMMVEIWHGADGIGEGERVWLDAHSHLQVHSIPTDDWDADTGVHLFTADDNPE